MRRRVTFTFDRRSEMCMLRAARWKYRTQKIAKQSPSGHHLTTLSGYIFATKACIDNRKKLVKQQYLLHMSSYYGELRLISGWDLLASLGHPCKFQQVSRLGSVTARYSSRPIGRQPNFAALNRRRHLYSAGRPSRWAFTHILVYFRFLLLCINFHRDVWTSLAFSALQWDALIRDPSFYV